MLAVEHGDLKGVTVQNIPSYRSVHTILYRWKQGHFPRVPRLLTDIPTNIEDFPEAFKTTLDGRPFLLNIDKEDSECHLIFATDESIQLLANAMYIFVDGTFKVTPDIFNQFY